VFQHAFTPASAAGGAAGYGVFRSLQYGVSRGIFSHGSGIGMAPFFQSANGDDPARGAFMAAAVPVFDTLVICTITGLVILSQGYWPWWTSAHLTVASFEIALGASGKLVVFACLVVFAFTTVTSWSHFAERCFVYLGGRDLLAFRLLVCAIAFCGPFLSVSAVWSLADILMGVLLVVHLLPLAYLVGQRLPELWKDLERPLR
jgi:AGCS family alanine or glycine:cation symporter